MSREKVVKLLELTRSENDHEAIVAMRAVNKLVPSWPEFFAAKTVRENVAKKYGTAGMDHVKTPTRSNWEPSIREMIEECVDRVTGQGAAFIESIAQQFHDKGWITPAQEAAVKKFYNRLN